MTEPTVYGTGNGDPSTHIESRHGPVTKPTGDTMTPEQFAELTALLTEMLTPGMELSKIYLAQFHAQVEAQLAAQAKAEAEASASRDETATA